MGKRSAFGQKSGGHLVDICLILVKKSFGNTAFGEKMKIRAPPLLDIFQNLGFFFNASIRKVVFKTNKTEAIDVINSAVSNIPTFRTFFVPTGHPATTSAPVPTPSSTPSINCEVLEC